MTKPKAPATEEELLDCLVELFSEAELESQETTDSFLQEAGLNPDEVGARAREVAEAALSRSPLNWRNSALGKLESERLHRSQTPPSRPKGRPELMSAIQTFARRSDTANERVTALWRNLEKATDEDLVSLLADLEYLEQQSRTHSDEVEE
jgi:hypothetical protein